MPERLARYWEEVEAHGHIVRNLRRKEVCGE